MTQQTRRWNPGDAAHVFVRVILSDAGTMLGGLTEDEWWKTLEWFDGRCAYTGEELGTRPETTIGTSCRIATGLSASTRS